VPAEASFIAAAVGSPILHQRGGGNGDQASNKKPGYAIAETSRLSPVAPRRCQGAAADGAGRALCRLAVQGPIVRESHCDWGPQHLTAKRRRISTIN
jgi:hypothetical protein